MATAIYEALTQAEKAQVRQLGATRDQVHKVVDHEIKRRSRIQTGRDTAIEMALSILSDAQEMLEFDIEDSRQAINRAKYILIHYVREDNGNGN